MADYGELKRISPSATPPHLIDLLLARWWHRTVVSAVDLAVAVARFAIGAGTAGVTQLLLLITSLVLVFVVQHGLKIHHCPGMPGLLTNGTNWVKLDFWDWKWLPCLFMMSFFSLAKDRYLPAGCNFSHPNIRVWCLAVFSNQLSNGESWREVVRMDGGEGYEGIVTSV